MSYVKYYILKELKNYNRNEVEIYISRGINKMVGFVLDEIKIIVEKEWEEIWENEKKYEAKDECKSEIGKYRNREEYEFEIEDCAKSLYDEYFNDYVYEIFINSAKSSLSIYYIKGNKLIPIIASAYVNGKIYEYNKIKLLLNKLFVIMDNLEDINLNNIVLSLKYNVIPLDLKDEIFYYKENGKDKIDYKEFFLKRYSKIKMR